MKDKRFEKRYLVLKGEDVKHFLSRDEQEALEDMVNKIATYRQAVGRTPVLEGVFIGAHWPEYKAASTCLYNRISGKDIYQGHPNLADMVSTHVDSLITILERVKEEDTEDDSGYIDHEIRALRHIQNAIKQELN